MKKQEHGDGTTKFLKELDGFLGKFAVELEKYKIEEDPKYDKAHELSVISLRLMQIVKLYEKKNPDRKDKNKDTEVPSLEEGSYVPTRSIVDENSHSKK